MSDETKLRDALFGAVGNAHGYEWEQLAAAAGVKPYEADCDVGQNTARVVDAVIAALRAPASEGEAWNAALEWVAGMLDTENDWAGASAFAMTVRAGRKRLRWDVDVDYMAGGLCTATVSVEAHNADEAAEKAIAVVLETRESSSVRNAVARLATHPAPATVTAYLPDVQRVEIENFLDSHEADDAIVKLADANGRPFTHVTAGWLRAALGGAR